MLRFIQRGKWVKHIFCAISIHPMLRFICIMVDSSISTFWFQYIPCYGLSFFRKETYVSCKNFNTSHVTVYLSFFLLYAVRTNISIHPMLRFIDERSRNNITVYTISIHPMLRFIYCAICNISFSLLISIHPMLRFIVTKMDHRKVEINFNTSHVTVYPILFHNWYTSG